MEETIRKKLGNPSQLCSAFRAVLEDGKARGERMIFADNGCLSFAVLEGRALDIAWLRHRGTNLSFLSKNGIVSHGDDFSRCFPGGFLYTCGLDAVGDREGHPKHGRLHHLPAECVSVFSDGDRIRIEGEASDTELFGGNLAFHRRIETEAGSGCLAVTDRITNRGFTDAGYVLLYHYNFGYPFLEEGTSISAEIASTRARTEFAEKRKADAFTMGLPELTEEQVFYHTLKGEYGEILVRNAGMRKSVRFRYDARALPHFIEWKSMVAGDYALGIEPSTTLLGAEATETPIRPGESKTYRTEILIQEEAGELPGKLYTGKGETI